MSNCIQCGKEIKQKEGARERKFCDNKNKCKQAYHNKNVKKPKYVLFKSFKSLKDELDAVKEENQTLRSKIEFKVADKSAYDGKKIERPILDEVGLWENAPDDFPKKQNGESSIEYRLRVAEWNEKQTK